ncbi:unnamed protein product [Oppiella nova]|uniref:Large ribosomal subunit protein mL42 n=1 Tax=Oppiella nova TaxID=334625 RepID=A0A7R9MG54_9ACAR|nr:unnamed protein product [Oppiella nova]CAG2175587.1 unnamed protein product [Oppiella nova]
MYFEYCFFWYQIVDKMLIKSKPLIVSCLRATNPWLASRRMLFDVSTKEAKITITNDGQTIVCLHADKHFPYEHSRPIPKSEGVLNEEESVLKIKHRIEGQNIHQGSGPDLEELQMLTYTPKWKWKYRPLKRVVPKPAHPRPGI